MKKIVLLLTICAAACVLLVFSYKYEMRCKAANMLPDLGFSDEQILQGDYFEILVPAAENRHLPCDVYSYSLGDGFVHIVLPPEVTGRAVVCYIRDALGNNLARRVYDFSNRVFIGNWEVVLDRNSLPTMYFETESPESYAAMLASPNREDICYGNMQLYVDSEMARKKGWYREYLSKDADFSTPDSASLQGRGQSSWNCDVKKSFSIRLERSMSLLGMPASDAYNLVGNAYDKSLVKNITFNKLADRIGIKHQPCMENISLYIDGVYQGVYTLTTKVNVDKNRISLKKGDYLYKMDPPTSEQPIYYESKTWFEDGLTYPVADLVYPQNASEKKFSEAADILQKAMNALENPDSEDFAQLIDIDSLVRYYWVEEASMNFDAWQRSVYIYYDHNDGKMHFGPVWDMDLALGSPYEKEGMQFTDPRGYRIRNAGYYRTLFTSTAFCKAVDDAYCNEIRQELFALADEFRTQKEALGSDAYLNWTMFGHSNLGTTLMYGETYDEYCENMIKFYEERIKWIDEQYN